MGAAADEVTALLPDGVTAVDNPEHHTGLGSSLRAGLAAAAGDRDTAAVLVLLVDLPDVGHSVIRRVLDVVASAVAPSTLLARATFRGRPGHPVVLGRDHWAGVSAAAVGDTGANGYLRRHTVRPIECGDLAGGADVDRPTGIR